MFGASPGAGGSSGCRQCIRSAPQLGQLGREDVWRKKMAGRGFGNPRMTWGQVKEWAGWKGDKTPRQLKDDQGQITNSPKKMANILSNYYSDKIKKIRKNQSVNVDDPLTSARKIGERTKGELVLTEVTQEHVRNVMRKVKNSRSLGPDNIQADLLKKSIKYTLPVITHLINVSIRTKKFARRWKVAKVVPHFKGSGEKHDSANYRPLSLLSPVSRLEEKIITI